MTDNTTERADVIEAAQVLARHLGYEARGASSHVPYPHIICACGNVERLGDGRAFLNQRHIAQALADAGLLTPERVAKGFVRITAILTTNPQPRRAAA